MGRWDKKKCARMENPGHRSIVVVQGCRLTDWPAVFLRALPHPSTLLNRNTGSSKTIGWGRRVAKPRGPSCGQSRFDYACCGGCATAVGNKKINKRIYLKGQKTESLKMQINKNNFKNI